MNCFNKQALRNALDDSEFLPEGGQIGFHCRHEYEETQLAQVRSVMISLFALKTLLQVLILSCLTFRCLPIIHMHLVSTALSTFAWLCKAT